MKHIIDIPKRVFEALDIVPNTEPIRGGTDGSQLSLWGYLHLIFYWLWQFPRSFEYASIDVMEKAVHVVVGIAQEVANSHQSYKYDKSHCQYVALKLLLLSMAFKLKCV